jgi:hypothetical protein
MRLRSVAVIPKKDHIERKEFQPLVHRYNNGCPNFV